MSTRHPLKPNRQPTLPFDPTEPVGTHGVDDPRYPSDWYDQPFVSFDLETTSPNPREARIVTWAIVEVHPEDEAKVHGGVIRPDGFEVPAEAAAIHGWTTERLLAHEPATDLLTALGEIAELLNTAQAEGRPIVIYNAPYDATVLVHECDRRNYPAPEAILNGPIIDPLVLDRYTDRWRKGSRKLQDVAAMYGVTLDGAHTAAYDALATGLLAHAILDQQDSLGALTLPDLHRLQVREYAKDRARFEKYLRDKKNDETITLTRGWPIAEQDGET